MSEQPAFQNRCRGTPARATEILRRVLCLPASEKLTDAEQDYVIDCVRGFFKRG